MVNWYFSGLQRALSSPTYVPANIPESGKSSGTEESEPDTPRRPRRVRFQNLAQGWLLLQSRKLSSHHVKSCKVNVGEHLWS